MDLINEINSKYLALEAEIDKKLEKVKIDEEKLEKQTERLQSKYALKPGTKILSYDEALIRNSNLLKSLEMTKARLRSRTTFSPVEQLLTQAIRNYKRDLERQQQLPSTSNNNINNNQSLHTEDNENIAEIISPKCS